MKCSPWPASATALGDIHTGSRGEKKQGKMQNAGSRPWKWYCQFWEPDFKIILMVVAE